ncbi:hypothetical protein DFJ74DRAFT_703358 [Hyaloraphidium curvatum]|nr:hypothetical protein DFJ74DRAFT_714801 [Hyaloraphidium curvatum]KAI9028378.1 hypothetical protein DFJ74DRAFT_703358 [Hyaloraphidium curvatum]
MSSLQKFVGRALFSALFILSGVTKLQDMGPVVAGTRTKFDEFKTVNFAELLGSHYTDAVTYAVYAAIGMELLGGFFFLIGNSMGVPLLIAFLAAVTPVYHNPSTYSAGSPQQIAEITHVMKNAALLGALLVIGASRSGAAKKKAE